MKSKEYSRYADCFSVCCDKCVNRDTTKKRHFLHKSICKQPGKLPKDNSCYYFKCEGIKDKEKCKNCIHLYKGFWG